MCVESLDYWRLCDELSVPQAAQLILGIDPSSEEGTYVDGWVPYQQPKGYAAIKEALIRAVLRGDLPATIRRTAWERGWDEEPSVDEEFSAKVALFFDGPVAELRPVFKEKGKSLKARGVIYRAEPDWKLTTVHVNDLRAWLSKRGVRTGFFFPDGKDEAEYLNPAHERYAPKLAAAVKAWLAVQDPRGKHPKQALMKWLRENAAEFGLSDDEGKPNEQGIEECAKVANWQLGGGAPKTPRT